MDIVVPVAQLFCEIETDALPCAWVQDVWGYTEDERTDLLFQASSRV